MNQWLEGSFLFVSPTIHMALPLKLKEMILKNNSLIELINMTGLLGYMEIQTILGGGSLSIFLILNSMSMSNPHCLLEP